MIGMVTGSLLVGVVLGVLSLRGSERDSSIGAVLAFGLGVGVLLLSLYQGYATEATNLLFGSIVGVDDAQLRVLAGVGARLAALAVVYRPLLFSSVDPDVAEARGVPVRALSIVIFMLLALTTAEAIQVVGVLLVLTLVITPAAAAQRLSARPGTVLVLAVAIALISTEGGILSRSRSHGRPASSSARSLRVLRRCPRVRRESQLTRAGASMWQLDVPDDRHRREHLLVILGVLTLFAIIVGTTILGIAEQLARTTSGSRRLEHSGSRRRTQRESSALRCRQVPGTRSPGLQHRDGQARKRAGQGQTRRSVR